MKKRFTLMMATLMVALMAWAQETGTDEQGEVSPYLSLVEGTTNDMTFNALEDGGFMILTTGSDPYVYLSALTSDLTDEDLAVNFEYKLSRDVSDLEFFFSPIAGGREMSFSLKKADDWTSASIDIAAQRSAYGWGAANDFLRLDPGSQSGTTLFIRNITVGPLVVPEIHVDLPQVDGVCQLSTADDIEKFASYINNDGYNLNAVLTADIDYTGHTTFIGTSSSYYKGTFDGQQHSITVDFNRNADNAALFGYMNGTVKNLVVKGTITTSGKYAAGVAAHTYAGSLVQNCVSLINVVSSISGDGTHGGLVAVNEGGLTIENCIYAGTMTGSATTNCAGIVGWSTGSTTMNSCIVAADMTGLGLNDDYTFSRDPGMVTLSNCYYTEAHGTVNGGGIKLEGGSDMLTSGEAAFKANGDQKNIVWYQNLTGDVDPYPVPFADHAQVYASGELRCDGLPLSSNCTYSNVSSGSAVPGHTFVDGVCTVCGTKQSDFVQQEDGWYMLGTPQQLQWFASFVNSGNPSAKAKLTADLDMSGIDFDPIGYGGIIFAGSFDGQMHRISNLSVNKPETAGVGLIGQVGGGTITIKNLVLDETCNIVGSYFGGIIGCSEGSGTIYMTNLGNEGNVTVTSQNAGGIIGCCDGSAATFIMKNCYSTGTITGGRETSALSGWFGSAGQATNCWSTATVSGLESDGTWMGRGTCTFTNCYATGGTQTTILAASAAESGELCYKVNQGNIENPIYYQTLGEDMHPVLDSTHGVVYETEDGSYADIHDAETFIVYRDMVIAADRAYLAEVIANKEMVESYSEALDALATETDRETFMSNYKDLSSAMNEIKESAAAYKAYQEEIDYVTNYLKENTDFEGPDRDLLVDYLESGSEPDETFENGAYEYIIENRYLSADEVNAETSFVKSMLEAAIANGYVAGTDITNLLTNADFTDGFNGWEGTVATGTGTSTTTGLVGAECWNSTFDMYQTLTDMKNGVYALTVNAAFRPHNTVTSTNYAASIYAGENMVYMPSVYETYIPVDEAVDGVNCNLSVGSIDLDVTDEEGNVIGYAMHGTISIANGAAAGRALNTILTNVTDGTLTVGMKSPGTGTGSDWTGMANVHLTYLGTMEQATSALDATLECQIARASTLIQAVPSDGEDFAQYPNFQQTLKDQLQEAITATESASSVEDKYALVQKFSQLFEQVYSSKQAYVNYLTAADELYSIASELSPDHIDKSIAEAAESADTSIWEEYLAGTITQEEAEDQTKLKSLSDLYLTEENGVAQINNNANFLLFARRVNNGETSLNASLNADIDYCTEAQIMYEYYGIFNGNYHTITVDISRGADDAALIEYLHGTVKNLVVKGSIATNCKYAAGVAAHSYDASVSNVASYVNITSTIDGDGTHGGLVAVAESGANIFNNCLFAGSMTGANTNSCGGIVGWTSGSSTMNNCLQIGDIQVSTTNGDTFSRGNTPSLTNCYYLNVYGNLEDAAIQTNEDQMKSGELCYMLNNSTDINPAWRQNLGVDEYPVPTATRQIVTLQDDGTYTNGSSSELAQHTGTADDPYPLSSLGDLKSMRQCMHAGGMTYFTLEEDIDMSTLKSWTPINEYDDVANGLNWMNWIDLDGKGHVIRNFSCTDGDYASFFGVLCGNVRNIGFEDVNVLSASTGSGVLGGYIGHSNFADTDGNKYTSTLENVWVTGNLTVTSSYCGGLVGNIGGPTVIKNCYANVNITSAATYTGGLVGRVRSDLTMQNVYAAGTSNVATGIVGGGQNDATPASTYTNCVVWNNSDQNFGTTAANDVISGVSYYDGSNFAELQQTVVNWGAPWNCDMAEGSYPVLDVTTGIQQIVTQPVQSQDNIYTLSGMRVNRTQKGLYIINGKKVLVK